MEKRAISYIRLSRADQDKARIKAEILSLADKKGLGKIHIIEEKSSEKTSWRNRTIADVLEKLEYGDTLLVNALSCLGRSMMECIEILSIAMKTGINIYAVKGSRQLDHNAQNIIIAMAFSIVTEIEKDLKSQRTRKALHAKKTSGNPPGRPRGTGKSKLDKYQMEIKTLLAKGRTQKFIANRYRTAEANLHYWLKKQGLKKVVG